MTINNPSSQHTFTLQLNNNAYKIRTFSYQQAANGLDLAVTDLFTAEPQPVPVPATVRFYATIWNYGSQNAANARYEINCGDDFVGSISFNLDFNHRTTVFFDLIISEEGTGVGTGLPVKITVVHSSDTNSSNNADSTVLITKSTPEWGGSWQNSSSLTVGVYYDDFNNTGYSNAVINSYLTKWNNISSNLAYTFLPASSASSADISVVTDAILDTGGSITYGRTYIYDSSLNEITDDPYNFSGYYDSARVVYNSSLLSSSYLERVLVHEMGHALGLAHIFESASSIMYPAADQGSITSPSSSIDYVNLRSKYGQ